jgi:hypothetical protein
MRDIDDRGIFAVFLCLSSAEMTFSAAYRLKADATRSLISPFRR